MSDLVWWVLSSTFLGGVLMCAGILLWLRRRELAWAHALVFLGMAKLVTPTMLRPPVDMPDLFGATAIAPASEPVVVGWVESLAADEPADPNSSAAAARGFEAAPIAGAGSGPPVSGRRADARPAPTVATSAAPRSRAAAAFPWGPCLVAVWGAGALALVGIGWRRHRRCRVLLRHAREGGAALQTEIAVLSARLGLRRLPEVRVVEADLSPFAVTFGRRSIVVLPRVLLDRLDWREVRAILAHELCHVAAGDVWARRLELLVATTHWWNPVAHWGRAWLRHLEELRCDARASELVGQGSKHYGRSLLKATALLDGDLSGLPLTASGLGGSRSLQTRLRMMTKGSLESRLGARGRCALFAGAASLLPLGVAAQDPVKAEPKPERSASAEQELRKIRSLVDRLLEERGAAGARAPRAPVAPVPLAPPAPPAAPKDGSAGAPGALRPATAPTPPTPPTAPTPGEARRWSVSVQGQSDAGASGSADGSPTSVDVRFRGQINGKSFEANSLEELQELLGDSVQIEAVDGRFGIGMPTGRRGSVLLRADDVTGVAPHTFRWHAGALAEGEGDHGEARVFVWPGVRVEGGAEADEPATSFWRAEPGKAGWIFRGFPGEGTPESDGVEVFGWSKAGPLFPGAKTTWDWVDVEPSGDAAADHEDALEALQQQVRDLEARIREMQRRLGGTRRDA